MFEKEADLAETEMLIHCHGDYSKKKNYREGWQEGANFGYNKANEWHYVKGGDLPPEDTRVFALMVGGEVCIAHFYRKNVWDKIGTVYAWKEIVLPKEIKEND
jgi:hypothetical protein